MKPLTLFHKTDSLDYSCDIYDSPRGPLTLIAHSDALVGLLWQQPIDNDLVFKKAPRQAIIKETKRQLKDYFSQKRVRFDLPLQLYGTPFQKDAWEALLNIPYGQTISYEAQARAIGNPKACRAIGSANGANPLSIIIPCHRVIAKDGRLGGYGGGLAQKKWLLDLES